MPSDSNPYAPPAAEAVAETEFNVENPIEQRVAYAKAEEVVKGIGIVAIGVGLVSAFCIYLVWKANLLSIIDVIANALPCVLLLVAGVMLRSLNPMGRVLFCIAIALTLGGTVMVMDMRLNLQLRMLIFGSPQLFLAAYLFAPGPRVVFSDVYREGIVRKTQEVMLNTPPWVWYYCFVMLGIMLAATNQRIHH